MNRCVEAHLASDVCRPRKLISGALLIQQVIHDADPKKTFFLKQWRMPERECE